MKKQKENSHEGITWSEMGKQNVQAEKVYYKRIAKINSLRKASYRTNFPASPGYPPLIFYPEREGT